MQIIKKIFPSAFIYFFNIAIKLAKKKFFKGFNRNKFPIQKTKKILQAEVLVIGNSSRTISRLAKILPFLKKRDFKIHSLLDQRVLFPLPSNNIHSFSHVGDWYPRPEIVKPEFQKWCKELEKFLYFLQNKAKAFSKKYRNFLSRNNIFNISPQNSIICLYDLIEWRILWDIHDKILELEYLKKQTLCFCK